MSQVSLARALARPSPRPQGDRAVVIGARGRTGLGALVALADAGLEPTCWDVAEMRTLDRDALLAHDVLVNAVALRQAVPPFLTSADVAAPGRRLTVVADVTCDVGSELNALPINDRTTDWQRPVRRVSGAEPALDVIAIDNLPSLLPREASTDFSAQLLPHLLELGGPDPAWERCRRAFDDACAAAGLEAAAMRS
jgi:saccharopine dehydrogenase (NAD+, L-lysine-forming)